MGSKAGTFLQLRLKAFPHLFTLDYTTIGVYYCSTYGTFTIHCIWKSLMLLHSNSHWIPTYSLKNICGISPGNINWTYIAFTIKCNTVIVFLMRSISYTRELVGKKSNVTSQYIVQKDVVCILRFRVSIAQRNARAASRSWQKNS